MELTDAEKSQIKLSYSLLEQHKANLAQCFYANLFELSPLIKPMFNKDYDIQEMHFNELIKKVVEGIDQFEVIKPKLYALGKKHNQFGVEANQFQIVKTALMLSIEYSLKGECTQAVNKAWSNYYDIITEIMIAGLNDSNCPT